MKIGNIDLSQLGRPFLVAEAGATHQGKPELAIQMTEAAIQAGADAVTFQEINEERLYSYLPQLPVSPQPRVGWNCLNECRKMAKKEGLGFSVCVTDFESLDMAISMGIDFIKIVSYDINFYPFLEKSGKSGLPIFMSTGASTFNEVSEAVACINADDRLLLYHTDCGYPTEDMEVNLKRMQVLQELFHLPVGYCDHTNHGLSCLMASCMGAVVIEKHFILNRELKGSDHMVALESDELKRLFDKIKRVVHIQGDGKDRIEEGDKYRRENLRRSLALNRDKKKGTMLTEDDLTMLRPGTGLSWNDRTYVVGKRLKEDIKDRGLIEIKHLE